MKKKGFTLIELLAVIVILAVIALIATPIILNMISTAKKGAAVDSAYGYISAIETYDAMNSIDSDKYPLITESDVAEINKKVKIKGEKPASGTVTIENGRVKEATMCINGYTVTYDGKKAKATTKCSETVKRPTGPTIIESTNGETYKAIVYLDPTDLNKKCDVSNSTSLKEQKTGCMKWYAYKKNSDGTYQLILDHNTTATVAWNSSGNKNDGMKEVTESLADDTTGWDSSLNARLITADEIAEISGANREDTIKWDSKKTFSVEVNIDINTEVSTFTINGGINPDKTSYEGIGWKANRSSETKKSSYAWVYDYTDNCELSGCNIVDNSTGGYWTSTPFVGEANGVWFICSNSFLAGSSVKTANMYGVRPVITF